MTKPTPIPAVRLHGPNGGNTVYLKWRERLSATSPGEGDVRLRVDVRQGGFTGVYDQVWIEAAAWRQFVDGLSQLERTRAGRVVVAAISPDEFELAVRSIDPLGHMAAEGFVGRHHFWRHGPAVISRVAFAFELDPSRLRELVGQFVALDHCRSGHP